MTRALVPAVMLAAAAALTIAVLGGGDRHHDAPRPPAGSSAPATKSLATPARRVVGYVRDVNGRPVPGATVRLTDGRARVRTSRTGRFALPAQPGRRRVMADRVGYTRQTIDATVRRGSGARIDFALAVTAPGRISVANSADRIIVWVGCDALAELSEAELQRWMDRGVDGFVCQTRHLFGLGGGQRFTGDGTARLHGVDTRLQRQLAASPAVRRARQGRLLLYLGFYASNFFNTSTPFADWFDDRTWSRVALPAVGELAAAARSMGFAGLAIDQELYPTEGNVATASWGVRYPGNRHSEPAVRAKAKHRGRQLMERMVRAYPGVELIAYGTAVPEGWQAKVSSELDDTPDTFLDNLQIDLWDGLSSVQGYSAIRWMDAYFYKIPQLPSSSWDTALQYNANSIYSYLSRRFSNWSYASSRLHLSPFSWIDEGPAPFDKARPPEYVAKQLDAFKRWGAGGMFANYAYAGLKGFDYGPYDDALRRASSPVRVDRRPPKLELFSPEGATRRVTAGETIGLDGIATDDFAIRAVRWSDDRGREGVARLRWTFKGDERSGWDGEMRWAIHHLRVPYDARRMTVTAEDIHGLASQVQLAVTP